MKYFILADGCTLGMKYNLKSGIMSIGGYTKFHSVLVNILLNIFEVEDCEEYVNYPQRNKERFDIKMSCKKYNSCIDKFKDSDYVLKQTETLYRIMR